MERCTFDGENQKKIEIFLMVIFSFYSMYMVAEALIKRWEGWIIVFLLLALGSVWIVHVGKYKNYAFRAKFMTIAMQGSLILYFTQLEELSASLPVFMVFVVLLGFFGIAELIYSTFFSIVFIFFFHGMIAKTFPLTTMGEVAKVCLQLVNILFFEYLVYSWTKRNSEGSRNLLGALEELQAVESRKDDFLANVSHEIRTPINTIYGMSELLLREELPYKIKEKIQSMQISGRNLLSVVSDILDFSELQSGKMELEEEAYNITSTINDVINMTVARKKEKRLELIVDCAANIPSALLGDEKKLRRVIMNLVDNAIKFTDEGGVSITIGCRKESYGINLVITVEDTGIGMDEAGLERIFSSFHQADTIRKRQESGIGLGLAISKALVQKMGGVITVKSRLGKGTMVRFTVPQKVLDETPIASLQNPHTINAATYINMEQFDTVPIRDEYSKMIVHMVEQLKAVGKCQICRNLAELQRREAKEAFSHIFISAVEYREDKAYFDALAERTKLVVILDQFDEKYVTNPRLLKIYKPFYILSIAAVLNSEYDSPGEKCRVRAEKFVTRDAHVLVVDDNQINIKVAEGLLDCYKIKVTTANSGQEALEKIISADYDFVFMDIMMPEMDGVETLRRIRQMVGTYYQKVPVVALTANAVAGSRETLLAEGFADFLEKPIEHSVLERVLKRNLPQQKIVSQEASGDDLIGQHDAVTAEEVREVPAEEPLQEKDGSLNVDWLEQELGRVGLDVRRGIMHCNGLESYISVLKGCCLDLDQMGTQAEELFQKKDWKNYIINVHGMKSAMRSIGATKLSELAEKLEHAGKDGSIQYILENHGELMKVYHKLFNSLRGKAWLYPQTEDMTGQRHTEELLVLEEAEFDRIMSEMEETMYALDGEHLLELMAKLRGYQYRGTALDTLWNPVKRKVEMSDYISAVEMVAGLKKKLDGEEVGEQ